MLASGVISFSNHHNNLRNKPYQKGKDLKSENLKTFKKEKEEDTRKWEDLPFLCIGIINTVNNAYFYNICFLLSKKSIDSMDVL